MKRFIVYAEEIKKLYIEVDADNKTDAYLKALKSKDYQFEYVDEYEPQFIILASNISEVVV